MRARPGGREDRRRAGRGVDLGPTWAKPRDEESIDTTSAAREAFEIAHRLGLTDEQITRLVCRSGRHLTVWTIRSWREEHRANLMSFSDAVRLAAVLPEEAAAPIVSVLMRAAGQVAVDLPEVAAGADTLERAGLDVCVQTGELGRAISEATADGVVTEEERARIVAEAGDVVVAGAWAGLSAGTTGAEA